MHFPEDRMDYSGSTWDAETRTWSPPPRRVGPDWRPNVPVARVLRLDGTARGRSAAYFLWKDEQGRQFPMFITDMADVVRAGVATAGGLVNARWMVAKRGTNFGIRLATDDEIASIPSPITELEQS